MRTSCRNFRWKPSWCRSCLTQALCRETGTLPESDAVAILFLFGMSFKNYQNEFGNQLNPQGRFQEFCQRGSSHWIRRLDVAKEHYTKHQGVVRESFRMTMSGPNLATGTFWCVHLRSHSQQVSRQIFIVFSFARSLDFHKGAKFPPPLPFLFLLLACECSGLGLGPNRENARRGCQRESQKECQNRCQAL